MTDPTPWDLPKRYSSKIAVNHNNCWLWTGAKQSRGYGCGNGKAGPWLAHRRIYELLVGPVPDGLTIDHLCLVKHCVNPVHLEPVTLAENNGRAADLVHATTPYPCGHPRTDENTSISRRRRWRPVRRCRECRNANARRIYAARKDAS